MSSNITVTFIGTTSGGGPTETRNCSSLVVDPLGNGSLWMVDCAEGTVRQFESQPYRPGQQRLRMSQVSKIFITHMHADHTMGTLTFLRNVLGIPKPKIPGVPPLPPNRLQPRVEIFGPRGIRRMLRMLWHMTHTHSEHPYVVHELLFPNEQPSVPAEVQEDGDEMDVRRDSECVGRDIWCDDQGFWRGIVDISPNEGYNHWGALVDAGPIEHRDPCIGYIIREVPRNALARHSPVPRKLVILGDTYDPSALLPLIHADPPFADVLPEIEPYGNGVRVRVPVTLLVHEATDCFLGPHVDPQGRTGRNRTQESVDAKTRERGHSTPAMAGAFARACGAERLVLNHIGARFPAPDPDFMHGAQARFRAECMREIERQAADGWAPSKRVRPQAAWDHLSVVLPPNVSRPPLEQEQVAAAAERLATGTARAVGAVPGGAEVDVDVHMQAGENGKGKYEAHAHVHAQTSGRAQASGSGNGNGHGNGERKRKVTGSESGRGSASHSHSRPGAHDSRREYHSGSGARDGRYDGQGYGHGGSGSGSGGRRRYEDKRPRKERDRPS